MYKNQFAGSSRMAGKSGGFPALPLPPLARSAGGGEKKRAGGGKGVRAARGGKIFLFSFAGNKFITYICTFQILKAMPTIFILFGF